jgi:propionyl-CoA carboxylase alpha chain
MPRIRIAASCRAPGGWCAIPPPPACEGLGEGLRQPCRFGRRPSPVPQAGGGKCYVRVDDGVRRGRRVSMFYDPMIAKLITWAPTREKRSTADRRARPVRDRRAGHNIDFLSALMQHPRFRAGALTTGFIAEEYPEGFHGAPASARADRQAGGGRGLVACDRGGARQPDRRPAQRSRRKPLRMGRLDGRRRASCGNRRRGGDRRWRAADGRGEFTPGQRLIEAVIDGEPLSLRLARTRAGWR